MALFDAAIALGITVGAIGSLLRGLLELALGEEEALGPPEILLTASPAFCAAFYAWHGFFSFVFDGNRTGCEKTRRRFNATGLFPE